MSYLSHRFYSVVSCKHNIIIKQTLVSWRGVTAGWSLASRAAGSAAGAFAAAEREPWSDSDGIWHEDTNGTWGFPHKMWKIHQNPWKSMKIHYLTWGFTLQVNQHRYGKSMKNLGYQARQPIKTGSSMVKPVSLALRRERHSVLRAKFGWSKRSCGHTSRPRWW